MSEILKNFTNHSGGAEGSDIRWERYGQSYGVITRAYGFHGHRTTSKSHILLSDDELSAATIEVLRANVAFALRGRKRYFPQKNPYVNKLLQRNWYQVYYSDAIFAIGILDIATHIVDGGTGWAVQMAINNSKPVFVFNYPLDAWYTFDYAKKSFIQTQTPILTRNFAGIGTRGFKQGKNYIYPGTADIAIKTVYQKTVASLKNL